MEYALREKKGNGMGGETHVGDGSHNGEVLWVCIANFGACLHWNVFECSLSLTASQTFFAEDFPTSFRPPGVDCKNLFCEVCFSASVCLNFVLRPCWIWETGHHGNGLSLQVVCKGMWSLWAQFV